MVRKWLAVRQTDTNDPPKRKLSLTSVLTRDAVCSSPDGRGCCSIRQCVDTLPGGSDAPARFHHGTWYRSYVATRGPSAATAENEADRYRRPGDQSQRY